MKPYFAPVYLGIIVIVGGKPDELSADFLDVMVVILSSRKLPVSRLFLVIAEGV